MPAEAPRRNHSALTRSRFALLLLAASTTLSAQEIAEFPVPSANADLSAITVGPDGALWFNEPGVQKIGRITTDGVITEYPAPDATFGITTGPDGNIWFTGYAGVGHITPAGVVTNFPPPTSGDFVGWDIVSGPEGAMWFTELHGHIGRVTMAGEMTLFPIPNVEEDVYGLAAGPDGNLWFGNTNAGVIGRMTPSGTVTEFPAAPSFDITNGPDGALWFSGSGATGRISTTGAVQLFPAASGFGFANITTGPDGNLWFAESLTSLGRLTPQGELTRFEVPTIVHSGYGDGSWPYGVVGGPDGNIWFTEKIGNKIGRLTPSGGGQPLCVADDHTLCLNQNRFSVRAAWKETPAGPSTAAHAARMTGDSGYFWFLAPDNVEVVVKVLKACADPFNSYWVFAAGLTNLGVDMTVTDMHAEVTKTYSNPPGTPFAPIQDTAAFATCP